MTKPNPKLQEFIINQHAFNIYYLGMTPERSESLIKGTIRSAFLYLTNSQQELAILANPPTVGHSETK